MGRNDNSSIGSITVAMMAVVAEQFEVVNR